MDLETYQHAITPPWNRQFRESTAVASFGSFSTHTTVLPAQNGHVGPGPIDFWNGDAAPEPVSGTGGEHPAPPAAEPGPLPPPTMDDVAAQSLLKRRKAAPSGGWRRAVHKLSGGHLNPGDSPAQVYRQALAERINQPLRGDYRIAFLSLKGGVGKTTTTVGLGSTFASLRGDRVIALDANPDFGTLAQRVPNQTLSTVRDLLDDRDARRYCEVRLHTSQASSRLEVLASERDPAVSEAFSEEDYRAAVKVLQYHYNLILTDCGTGLMHSAMNGVLALANSLVLVSAPAIDGARSAAATLDWLDCHGFGHLVERTVVVISAPRPGASTLDVDMLVRHFRARCRAVQIIPFDEHLSEGGVLELELLHPDTRLAFMELAALVAEDFPAPEGRHAGTFRC
ncbi:MinD/ParA family protein [Speluncibacter jeojiensis]|uniref:MinD/ParA family protein n=1 Tax=Speluncibacter jeojiensis TaxID=2710754 RepID=A0A9X4M6T2_9ACTN|nr:MinD/ParA family protein [Corynebacteriales bacterium D3-21]